MTHSYMICTHKWYVSYLIHQLTLIGKSWKTHPNIFPKFRFPWHDIDQFLENLSIFFEISISGAWTRPLSGKFIQSRILELWGMTETDYWKTHPKRGFSRQEICSEFSVVTQTIFGLVFQKSVWLMTWYFMKTE